MLPIGLLQAVVVVGLQPGLLELVWPQPADSVILLQRER